MALASLLVTPPRYFLSQRRRGTGVLTSQRLF